MASAAVNCASALAISPCSRSTWPRLTCAIVARGWCVIAWVKYARPLAASPRWLNIEPRLQSAPQDRPVGLRGRLVPTQVFQAARALEERLDALRGGLQPAIDLGKMPVVAIMTRCDAHSLLSIARLIYETLGGVPGSAQDTVPV